MGARERERSVTERKVKERESHLELEGVKHDQRGAGRGPQQGLLVREPPERAFGGSARAGPERPERGVIDVAAAQRTQDG